MVRIIKRGTLPEEQEYQFECDHCHTIFVCQKSELRYSSSPKNESYYIIKCPVCKLDKYIDDDILSRFSVKKGSNEILNHRRIRW